MKRRYDSDSEIDNNVIEENSILDMDADEAVFSAPATPRPPTAKAMPKVTPPPPEELKRPKHSADKQLTSILHGHLPAIAAVGDLQTVFVTILPDLAKSKEDAWKDASRDLETIRFAVLGMPGVVVYFIGLETHPGSRPKKSQKGDKSKKKRNNDGEEDDEEKDASEGEEEELEKDKDKNKTKSTTVNPRTHFPHFHILLYFPLSYYPRLDFAYAKRILQEKFPGGDINSKRRTKQTSEQREKSFVTLTAYVLKGAGCGATGDNWRKYVDSSGDTSAPLPSCHAGISYSYDTDHRFQECCKRIAVLLVKITQWCSTTIAIPDTSVIEAVESKSKYFYEENEITIEHRAMREFATLLGHLGFYVGIKRHRGLFFKKVERTDYVVTSTYSPPLSLVDLKYELSQTSTQGEGYLIKYGKRLSEWFDMIGTFNHVPPHRYDWVELKDCYYCVATHKFEMKEGRAQAFPHYCFRSYPYTRELLEKSNPTLWLQLVEHVCGTPDPAARHLPKNRIESKGAVCETTPLKAISKDVLLRQLALLLRRRDSKQPVPFFWGPANTGKTTIVRFLIDLYPCDAVANISDCVTPLATLHSDTAILFQDEFNPQTIKRELVLRLLDGSQRLDVRRMHQNPELIVNPMMPIVMTDNYQPAYRNDCSEALDSRLMYFHFTRTFPNRDLSMAKKIGEEHLFIVYYLNHLLCNSTL